MAKAATTAIVPASATPDSRATRRPPRAPSQARTGGAATSGKPLVITASPSTARPSRGRSATTSQQRQEHQRHRGEIEVRAQHRAAQQRHGGRRQQRPAAVASGSGRQRAAEHHHRRREQERPAGEGPAEGLLPGADQPRQHDRRRCQRRVLEELLPVGELAVEDRLGERPVDVQVVDAVVRERRHPQDHRPAGHEQCQRRHQPPPQATTASGSRAGSAGRSARSRSR